MTKEQFLARCETAYDMGLATPGRLRLLGRWVEAVMRLEGGQFGRAVRQLLNHTGDESPEDEQWIKDLGFVADPEGGWMREVKRMNHDGSTFADFAICYWEGEVTIELPADGPVITLPGMYTRQDLVALLNALRCDDN